jgi:hypothetical protein
VCIRRVLSIEDHLRNPNAIAQIDEGELTEVATLRDPTHQYYLLADIVRTKIAARVSSFQISEVIQHQFSSV